MNCIARACPPFTRRSNHERSVFPSQGRFPVYRDAGFQFGNAAGCWEWFR